MGFRFRDWGTHWSLFIVFSVKNPEATFEVCFGSESCWKTNLLPTLIFLEDAKTLRFRITQYINPSMISSRNSRFPMTLAPKHAHTVTDPPPCLIVGSKFFVLSASPFFHHNFWWPSDPNRSTLVLSVQITDSHKLKGFETYSRAYKGRLSLFFLLRYGFFRAVRHWKSFFLHKFWVDLGPIFFPASFSAITGSLGALRKGLALTSRTSFWVSLRVNIGFRSVLFDSPLNSCFWIFKWCYVVNFGILNLSEIFRSVSCSFLPLF